MLSPRSETLMRRLEMCHCNAVVQSRTISNTNERDTCVDRIKVYIYTLTNSFPGSEHVNREISIFFTNVFYRIVLIVKLCYIHSPRVPFEKFYKCKRIVRQKKSSPVDISNTTDLWRPIINLHLAFFLIAALSFFSLFCERYNICTYLEFHVSYKIDDFSYIVHVITAFLRLWRVLLPAVASSLRNYFSIADIVSCNEGISLCALSNGGLRIKSVTGCPTVKPSTSFASEKHFIIALH